MVTSNNTLFPHISEWVDLTHPLSNQIPVWGGECGFKLTDFLKYEDCKTDCKFLVQQFEMFSGAGTHMDAPAHCIPSGKTIADFKIQELISPCVMIDISQEAHENYVVPIEIVRNFEKKHQVVWKDAFVIFHTGWGRFWKEPEKYRNNHQFPSVSKEVAEYLLSEDVAGIGVDTLSPDTPESGYPVHQIILGAGKYIIENIANAALLPATGSSVIVMPLPIVNGTEAPIRLLGMLAGKNK